MNKQILSKETFHELKMKEEFLPDSNSMSVIELEDREVMLVIWRRGDGFFPEDQTHRPQY